MLCLQHSALLKGCILQELLWCCWFQLQLFSIPGGIFHEMVVVYSREHQHHAIATALLGNQVKVHISGLKCTTAAKARCHDMSMLLS